MRITAVRIRNFRGIASLDLELGRVTVLIGENNIGKTSVLDALKLCLKDLGPRGRVVFDGLDFHLPDGNADPASADPIQIEIIFSDRSGRKWDDDLLRRLGRARVLQVDQHGHNQVRLLVTCEYDPGTRDFRQDWSFLTPDGRKLVRVPSRALTLLREEVRYYYLTALRDAARHFNARGPFWRPFLQDSQLSPAKKAEIESRLREVNELVVSSHASFEQVRAGLRRVQSVIPLAAGQTVSIEAVPGRMFDMLAAAQVQLGATTGANIPLDRHGEGIQSLAVLMLFSAFLEVRTGGTAGIKAFHVGPDVLSNEETRKFNYHIRLARGELLFARCWLLVEGQTETWVYPAAAQALGLNLHREGVRVVEFSQSDVGMFAKVANALGISWYCVGDDDENRRKNEPKLQKNLNGAQEADRYVFPYPNIEVNLLRNRYEHVYRKHMPAQNLKKIDTTPGNPSYWLEYAKNLPRRAKTRAATEVAMDMERSGEAGVPSEIRAVLERVVSLAQGGWQ